jgi:hypothetical protein
VKEYTWPTPNFQAGVHAPDLNPGIGHQAIESFLDFVQAKTVQTTDGAETVLPVSLGEAVQGTGARLKNNGQVRFDISPPGVKGGFKNRMQHRLQFRRFQAGWQLYNQAQVNV